jgi:hypothetical protein
MTDHKICAQFGLIRNLSLEVFFNKDMLETNRKPKNDPTFLVTTRNFLFLEYLFNFLLKFQYRYYTGITGIDIFLTEITEKPVIVKWSRYWMHCQICFTVKFVEQNFDFLILSRNLHSRYPQDSEFKSSEFTISFKNKLLNKNAIRSVLR